jgi:ABC-type branched-subunit amino acid transport system substrate-binding protein
MFSNFFEGYLQATKKKASDVKAGLISEENAAGTTGIKIVAEGLTISGMKVVNANANYPAATAPPPSDITPYVNELLSGDPNLIEFVTSDKPIVPLATALRAAGYKGDFMNFVYEDERIFPVFNQQYAALDGAYSAAPGIGWQIPTDPAFTQIRSDLDAAGFHVPISSGVLYGYGAARLFLEALKATPEPLTTEGLANTINGFTNGTFTDPGLGTALCPMIWPLGHVTGSPCGHVVKIDSKGTNSLDLLGIGKPGQYPGGFDPVVPGRFYNLYMTDIPKS